MELLTFECNRCKGRFKENPNEVNTKCPLCKKGDIVPLDDSGNDEVEYRHGYPVRTEKG